MESARRAGLRTVLNELEFAANKNQADDLPSADRVRYLDQHADRFFTTVELVERYAPKAKELRVLDIGSFPYYLPVLLQEIMDATVEAIDLPKESYWPGAPYQQSTNMIHLKSGPKSYELKQHVVNIEHDRFESSALFDVVIFTEILEHLVLQPNYVLEQIHRNLKPGGIVIVSTPNAHYLMKILSLLRGKNLYERYNLTLGAYGRHNREYLFNEVCELLESHHFQIHHSELRNLSKTHLKEGRTKYQFVDRLTHLPLLGRYQENIFVVAEKQGESILAEPTNLFRR